MDFEIIEQLKRAIAGYKESAEWESIGSVVEVGDGVARIVGLRNAQSQEILTIETEGGTVPALALNLEEEVIGALILGGDEGVRSGARVTASGNILSVPVGRGLLGRVITPVGDPVDGLGPLFKDVGKAERYPLEKKAPSVLDREPVNTPIATGLKSIDSMIPIGRGQRELIIGDRQTGKTAIAIDAIINQQFDTARRRPVCIYVAIGQKEAKIRKIVATLDEKGALPYTVVVSAPSSAPAAFSYLAPFAGCAIGEYFMDKGEDALVIYDDLSKHAWAYRQISLLLRRPAGREAYPGDVFYLHSRLLERAAKLNDEKGGGSLTALPIIETQLGDIAAYIPTNVISITDGQIYLESDLFYQGIRPAINVGLSVSRVGSSAQTKAMKKVAGKLRLELAQFRELQAFVQFASDVDEATRQRIRRGQALTDILKQDDLSPITLEKQVVVIYAAVNGYFDEVALDRIPKLQTELLDHFDKLHSDGLLKDIRESGELPEKTEKQLKAALDTFDFK